MGIPPATPAAIRYGLLSLLLLAVALWLLVGTTATAPQPTTPEWQAHWQASAALTTARRAFAAVTTTTHVYAIGGMDSGQNYIATVEYAPILADGSLGPWQTTASLNEARFYLAATVVGNTVYAIGGANGPRGSENSPSAVVERSEILPDGRLGPWQVVNELTTPRRGLQAVSHNNHLYAIGGYNGAFLKNVERADIDAHGQLGSWQLEAETATVDRYIHSATSYQGRIYLMAGHVEKGDVLRGDRYGGYGDVESAAILTDGRLGPWQIEKSSLLEPRFIASAVALNGFLYLIGGHDGSQQLRSVESAPILAQGHIGPWQRNTPLTVARSATTAVALHDRIYVLGGGSGADATATTEWAQPWPNGVLKTKGTRPTPK